MEGLRHSRRGRGLMPSRLLLKSKTLAKSTFRLAGNSGSGNRTFLWKHAAEITFAELERLPGTGAWPAGEKPIQVPATLQATRLVAAPAPGEVAAGME